MDCSGRKRKSKKVYKSVHKSNNRYNNLEKRYFTKDSVLDFLSLNEMTEKFYEYQTNIANNDIIDAMTRGDIEYIKTPEVYKRFKIISESGFRGLNIKKIRSLDFLVLVEFYREFSDICLNTSMTAFDNAWVLACISKELSEQAYDYTSVRFNRRWATNLIDESCITEYFDMILGNDSLKKILEFKNIKDNRENTSIIIDAAFFSSKLATPYINEETIAKLTEVFVERNLSKKSILLTVERIIKFRDSLDNPFAIDAINAGLRYKYYNFMLSIDENSISKDGTMIITDSIKLLCEL